MGGKESLYEVNFFHTTDISQTSLTLIVFAASVKHHRPPTSRNLSYLTANIYTNILIPFLIMQTRERQDPRGERKKKKRRRSGLPQSPAH